MHFSGLNQFQLDMLRGFGAGVVSKHVSATASYVPVAENVCTIDGAYIWHGGAWNRIRVSETCQGYSNLTVDQHVPSGQGGVDIKDDTSGLNHGPIFVNYDFDDDDASSSSPTAASQTIQVGPFMIPANARRFTVHWEGLMPEDWRAFIVPELEHDCSNCITSSLEDATQGHPYGRLQDFFGPLTRVNKDLVSLPEMSLKQISQTGNVKTFRQQIDIELPDQPIAVVERQDTGETWGMFMVVMPRDPTYPWDSTTNPYILNFFWRKQPRGVWDWIKRIHAIIHDTITQAACSMLPTANKTPNPYVQAGAILLTITGECNGKCPPGMTYNDPLKICSCPLGQTYDPTTQTCIPYVPAPLDTGLFSMIPWWAWIGIGLGAVAAIAKATSKPKPA